MDGLRTTSADKPRAPSYFSQFFQCQLQQAEDTGDKSNTVRTLYIDRDPVTFKDISLHLQGYHVKPRDGSHFVKMFADAQFYSCMFSTRRFHRQFHCLKDDYEKKTNRLTTRSTPSDVPTL